MNLATGLRIYSYASVDYRVLPPAGIEPLTLSVEGGAPRPLGYGTPSLLLHLFIILSLICCLISLTFSILWVWYNVFYSVLAKANQFGIRLCSVGSGEMLRLKDKLI